MPHKEALLTTLLECYRQHTQSFQTAVIALLCVVSRAFYTGAEWRKVLGDSIFCPLIAVLLGTRVPEIHVHGITIDHTLIAALVGTAGMHGVRLAAKWAQGKKELFAKLMTKQS